jgi:hypothetical protein
MPGENENQRNLSHHGIKESAGFAQHSNVGIGSEMGPGLLSMTPINVDPHRAGPRSNVGFPEDHRPHANDMPARLLPANGALNPDPHPYRGDRKEPNTYGKLRR